MRAIMNIFKYKKAKKLKRKKGSSPSPKKKVHEEFNLTKQDGQRSKNEKENDPLLVVNNKFDLLEELQRQQDDDEAEDGYTINKELILEAWKRFRPVNKDKQEEDVSKGRSPQKMSSMRHGRGNKPRTKQILIEEILGKKFVV